MNTILKNFLPWILYFVLIGHTQEQLTTAIIVAAISSIILERKELKKGFILSWGTCIFFIFMLITVVLFKNNWVAMHAWIFSNGTLALIAWVSILLRRPFTMQYAKEKISKDKWQHPLFIKINYILTTVWGICFCLSTALHVLKIYYPLMSVWVYETVAYAPIIFAIWFTTWFPNWYRDKQREKLTRTTEKNPR